MCPKVGMFLQQKKPCVNPPDRSRVGFRLPSEPQRVKDAKEGKKYEFGLENDGGGGDHDDVDEWRDR